MVSIRAAVLALGIAAVLFVVLALPALLRTIFGPVGRLLIPGVVALVVGYVAYEVLSGWRQAG